MPLELERVKGNNYFSIYPRDVVKSLGYIAAAAKEDGADVENLKMMLGECIGCRVAQNLATSQDVAESAMEELGCLQKEDVFLKKIFRDSIRAAKDIPSTEFDAVREIEKDAIYHTLARSGVLKLSFIGGRYVTDESGADAIYRGDATLPSFFPARFSMNESDAEMIAISLVDNKKRSDLLRRLGDEFCLSEDQVKQIDDALLYSARQDVDELLSTISDGNIRDDVYKFLLDRREFMEKWEDFIKEHVLSPSAEAYLECELRERSRTIGNSQPFKIAYAVKSLLEYKTDVAWVLPPSYRRPDLYRLAYLLMNNSGIRRLDERHFHTPVATTSAEIANYMSGDIAMQQDVLKYLCELTGENAFSHVTRWRPSGGGIDVIHPNAEIDDATLGAIFGSFLARASKSDGKWVYFLHNLAPDEFMDTLEGVGRLPVKRLPSDKKSPISIHASGKSYRHTRVAVPKQIGNVYETVAGDLGEYEKRSEFVVAALRHYAKNKGSPFYTNDRPYGYTMNFPDADTEGIVRRFAATINLSISQGSHGSNQKRTHVRNPEAIGLRL